MRETKEFKLFGHRYKLTQISAAEAFKYMAVNRDPREELMSLISGSHIYMGGGWMCLDEEVINKYVADPVGVMQPRFVLKALVKQANDFNFGFLKTRKSHKVPNYLRPKSEYEMRQVEGESPILGVLVGEGKATLRELQEFYSLEDAFRIYDILFVEKLNSAEAHHEAFSKSKRKRRTADAA